MIYTTYIKYFHNLIQVRIEIFCEEIGYHTFEAKSWMVVDLKRDKHLGITISGEHHGKLVYIAEYEGRSMSGQIL